MLIADSTTQELGSSEWLFRRQDPSDSVHFVESGRLEVVLENPVGVKLREFRPGSDLGELGLLTRAARSASVRVIAPSRLIRIDGDRFMHLAETDPRVGLALARYPAEQITGQPRCRVATGDLRRWPRLAKPDSGSARHRSVRGR